MLLFDTHAHYDDERFDGDRDALLRSMPEHGIGLIVNPGCDLVTSQKAVSYAETYDFVYAAVGYHPENLADGVDLAAIETLAQGHPRVRAIGEIGLDYYWEKDPDKRRYQQEIFHAQMRMAKRLGLPVIVHDREAHLDTLTVVEQHPGVTGVFHCYSGSAELAKQLVKLGYYISFTGVITYKSARKPHEVIREIPLDRIMIETDAPYLSPEPYRGKRNSSLYVRRVAEQIAEVLSLPVEEVVRVTMENGKRFFGIG
ncbi:MAG: TatD family hydrolase [Intestinibacillus sp.]